jgi:hypothetical protein
MTVDPSSPVGENRSTILAWAGISLAAALLLRVLLWLTYSPVAYSDTPSYRRLAESVLDFFAMYDGTRTPGYPVFLALVGPDTHVWVAQMVMGGLITMAMFYLGWQLSGKVWFGGLMALAHSTNLGQLFFEANLLTETLTTFCLAAVSIYVYILLRNKNNIRLGSAFGLGLAAALALLSRPLFIFLPIWLGLVLFWPEPGKRIINTLTRRNFARLVVFVIPVLLFAGGWVLFLHQRFGDWGMTTMTGFHMVQHTGSYFEYVPDEYAAIRDTYIQYRDAHIAEYGTQTNTIWEAIPELSQVSGLNFYDLSRTLARISIRLIIEHPNLFLKNVVEGWWMFWRSPVYWSPDALRFPALAGVIEVMIMGERVILFSCNLIFIAASLVWVVVVSIPVKLVNKLPIMVKRLRSIYRQVVRTKPFDEVNRLFFLFTAGNIWITSILQTLLDHGDNPRFLVPLQSWVVLWVAWFIYTLLRQKPNLSSLPGNHLPAGDNPQL